MGGCPVPSSLPPQIQLDQHLPPHKMELFLLLSLLATLISAAPERHRTIRQRLLLDDIKDLKMMAAPGYDRICQLSKKAYENAKAVGETEKIAGVIAAKTFYVELFNSKITGSVPQCKTGSKSVADMVKYFNTASANKMNVLTPICKASTLAFFDAKIKGKSSVEAKLAAAAAYMPLILADFGADPGQACIKSQDYINN